MNGHIQEILNAWYEDNGRIGDLTNDIWDRAFKEGRKSKTWIPEVTAHQVYNQIQGLTTMDDDETMKVSEHLAAWFNDPNRDAPVNPADKSTLVYTGHPSCLVVEGVEHRFHGQRVEVQVTRSYEHLAEDEAEGRRERMVLSKIVDDLVGEQIPDYETWFEKHGPLQVAPIHEGGKAFAVHELYTHFRARLLDELRQAGVIGGDQ